MHTNHEILEKQLETYEEELRGLRSYVQELKTTCDHCGTPKEVCASDLTKATNNIAYYEGEIARIKKELGTVAKVGPLAGTLLPQTRNQGIGAAILSSISFVAGALLGSRLKSGKGDKDR
jgi:hypothetical protein